MTQIEPLLKKLAGDPALFSRFLHTLSFLEYVGARKILKSLHESEFSMELLSHASEELRHARVFKKLAEEVAGENLLGYLSEDLLCMNAAKNYFRVIDSKVKKVTTLPHLAYAMTTLLVEERAVLIYPQVEFTLSLLGFSGRVSGILKEEQRHLEGILEILVGQDVDLKSLRNHEEQAFRMFLKEMVLEVNAAFS